MYCCYIDEAGCPGALPSATSPVQPVLVIGALIIPQANLAALTRSFLALKRQFNPGLLPPGARWLDLARSEIKGSDLRRDIRTQGRNRRRAVFGFLDKVLQALEANDAKLMARVWIKGPGQPFAGKPVYTSSVQALCTGFQRFLEQHDSSGIMIADSRTPALNSGVAHSVFTQKFKTDGDAYPRILEMPTFGHSENHMPIQITDFLCSAIIMPMATHTFCSGHVTSVHVHANDAYIKARYAARMQTLCYRYFDGLRWRGGFSVHDAILQRPGSLLLQL